MASPPSPRASSPSLEVDEPRRRRREATRGEPQSEPIRLDPSPDGLGFRVLPSILSPPPAPLAPAHAPPPPEVLLAIERLVSRLRVGRSREGALVELRVTLGGREVDVRLTETHEGIVLVTDEPALARRLGGELARRGIALAGSRG